MSSEPVCLITGGASGIGAACVEAFAAAGYCVLFGDLQAEKGETLARKLGAKVVFIELDVRVESDFAQAVAAANERWGRLDCLVNNAAIAGVLGPIASIPLEEYEHACSIIQRSVFLGMRVTLIGQPATGRATLLVSNHISWTDIVAIGSVADVTFVATREVGVWFFVGLMARLQRTIFVDRTGRSDAGRTTR